MNDILVGAGTAEVSPLWIVVGTVAALLLLWAWAAYLHNRNLVHYWKQLKTSEDQLRISQEQQRVSQEQQRVSQEQQRVSQEHLQKTGDQLQKSEEQQLRFSEILNRQVALCARQEAL